MRPLRSMYRQARDAAITFQRTLRGGSDTWWEHLSRKGLREAFLRDSIEGVNHPSRKYVRDWLAAHPGLTLLDIPCGPGVEYEGFQSHDTPVKYIGMDLTDSMLAVVRSRFNGIDVRKGDITKIPLPDKSIDVVLCRHILEHLDDYRPAIREAVRVACKHVLLVLFRLPTGSERKEIGWGAWDNRLDRTEFEEFVRSLGVSFSIVTLPYPYPVPPTVELNTVVEIALQG